MTARGSFTTSITIEDDQDGEADYDVRVTYSRYEGYKGGYYQPPEDPSVEILEIIPADKSIIVPSHFYEDDGLIAECMEDWQDDCERAAEYKAEARAEMLREDRQ
jgi:hypothetical protein